MNDTNERKRVVPEIRSAKRRGRSGFALGLLLALATASSDARAAVFPANAAYRPIAQAGGEVGDPLADGQNNGREIVGTADLPALQVASDGTHFFFRLRLDVDPLQNAGNLRSFGWGLLFDTDGALGAYEFLLMVDGIREEIVYAANTTKTGGPGDDAETELAVYPANYAAGGNIRVVAAGSNLNGTPDHFLDVAVPIADLAPGITPSTPLRIWAGSSNSARRIDVDLAWVNGLPGNALEAAASAPVLLSGASAVDTDGDGVPDAVEDALGSDKTRPDTDGDGIPDAVELSAAGAAGPFSAVDTDADGTIDARDLDSDNDCAPDTAEGQASFRAPAAAPDTNCVGQPAAPRCDVTTGRCVAACLSDVDCAGAGRICELAVCRNGCRGGAAPKACAAGEACSSADATPGTCRPLDTDGDGVPDAVEDRIGTDKAKADSDGDGLSDAVETSALADGAAPYAAIDTDGDGRIDARDLDSDGDCLPDQAEPATFRNGGAPSADANANCPPERPVCSAQRGVCIGVDSDGDGLSDDEERALGSNPASDDTDGDGLKDGDEVDEGRARDTDGDGLPDVRDPDDDNDGIVTADEIADTRRAQVADDVDGDGKPSWLDTDADGDGASDGAEGRGDADGDRVPDYLDANVRGDAGTSGGDAGTPPWSIVGGEGSSGSSAPTPGAATDDGLSLEGGGFGCSAGGGSSSGGSLAFLATLGALVAGARRRRRRDRDGRGRRDRA